MNDQETPRRAETDHRDRSDVGEPPAPSGAEQGGSSAWLLLIDVGLSGLLGSILVAVVSIGVFWFMEAYRTFNIDPMGPTPPMELGWVVPGGVTVGLAFMGCVYGLRPWAEKVRGATVVSWLFFLAALVAGMIASKLFDAASG